MQSKHMDEALREAIKALGALVQKEQAIERAVLVNDLFGHLRAGVWTSEASPDVIRRQVDETLKAAAGIYWTGDMWIAGSDESDRAISDSAWEEGRAVEGSDRFRLLERFRRNNTWKETPGQPLWQPRVEDSGEGPPVVVFYSFKGGAGRSTALASFAIQRARGGERIVALDLDLDAPGVGTLLASDDAGTIARWGIVDYFLERPLSQIDLQDYYHACRRENVTGPGEILVIPSGQTDSFYLSKLARVDFELPNGGLQAHPLFDLLKRVRSELDPQWILIDARAGLSEPAGLLLSGLAHLYILFGTSTEQSWQGLRLVLRHLGAKRVLENRAQIECLLVQAMVPEDMKVATLARGMFSDRARDEFSSNYYAQDPDDPDEDKLWYVRDLEDEDAPHASVPLSYKASLAHFDRVDEIADVLADSPEYRALAKRIASRFGEIPD
jgi:cellulose biosynthesis protein BcsQ